MFISNVDSGLERLLRARLPLPEEVGDVAFDVPTSGWSAQLSRITVNLFLYDVQRSAQPSRSATLRPEENGGSLVRRRPQPMVQLGYLVSAWAGNPRDEHQLLGHLVSILAGTEALPEEYVVGDLSSTVRLSLGDEKTQARDIWGVVGGTLKAAVVLQVTVAADTFDWEEQAPAVTRIEALANRWEEPVDA
ncbi:DUF4255 domain-containing protein [Nocardioides sp.]|uniref:DUF4255 domain-containing protein n=1 Tax=Nocardioides sp. TaxID=35761 RepID=UPI00356A4DB7